MNFERKRDMLAWQWCRGDRDFELMLSLEFGRWALPMTVEHSGYGGWCNGYTTVNRVATMRILCGAVHFSWDRTFKSPQPRTT